MRLRAATLLLIAALVAVSASQSLAAPANITSTPSPAVSACESGNKCIARGVGDFNGDGIEDVLYQEIPLRATTPDLHSLHLVLGPVAGPDAQSNVTEINVTTPERIVPLNVVDVNGDGFDDLVVTHSIQDSEKQRQFVTVLLGKETWKHWALGVGSYGDIIVTRTKALPYWEEAKPVPSVSADFADINGDGAKDLIMAIDPTHPEGESEIAIMLADGEWGDRVTFRTDATVGDLGNCKSSLAGTGDVTGDGLTDVVVRHCPGEGVPDMPRLIEGRTTWERAMRIDGIVNVPELPADLLDEVQRISGSSAVIQGPNVPRPPTAVPGRGYIPAPSFDPLAELDVGEAFFLEDLNGDGVDDVALEFAGKTHIWHGGPDIGDALAANRSTGIILNADYGALALTRSWRMTDFSGDGTSDMLFTLPVDLGNTHETTNPRGGRTATFDAPPIHVFTSQDVVRSSFIDVEATSPDAVWHDPALFLWAVGDFNGDGNDDLLVGPTPSDESSEYGVVFGPFTE